MQRSVVIKKNILLLKVKASVWENEKVLEMDDCECARCHWILHLKKVKWGISCCLFNHSFLKNLRKQQTKIYIIYHDT